MRGRAQTPERGSARTRTPSPHTHATAKPLFCPSNALKLFGGVIVYRRQKKRAIGKSSEKFESAQNLHICKKSCNFAAETKTQESMKKNEIKFDERNYRKHSDKNKALIKKSLEELGAGRSVVIDADDTLVAGNGVYEQAQKLKMPVRVVETDGSELVVVKRTDIHTQDEKRRKLALADNVASDLSEFDVPALQADWTKEALADWCVELPDLQLEQQNKEAQSGNGLPAELQGLDLEPDDLEKIQGTDEVLKKRVIIVYDEAEEAAVAKMLGVEAIEKIVYNFDEL